MRKNSATARHISRYLLRNSGMPLGLAFKANPTFFEAISEKRNPHLIFRSTQYNNGARGSLVVKALRYKPVGRGVNSRCCHWNFSVT